jgi:hypothetical protein
MRTRFLALGAATIAALTFAACGGGGGGSTTTPQTVASPPSNGTAPNPILQVINATGPTTQVSVTLKLPQRTGTSATVHAAIRSQFGSRLANAHIRTMMNTAPTSQMRALGQQQNVYAQAVQKRSGRAPQFISGSTSWVELVMTDTNNTVLSDGAVPCSVVSQQCTATFTVPIGNNLTATLLLYDSCPFLLGAGSASVNVLAANNPALNITVNGVVSSFEVTPTPATSPAPPVTSADGSQAQAIGVTVAPLDADDDVIGSPGTLITSDFLPITNVTLNATSPNNGSAPTTLSNATGTVTPDATNVFSSATFPFTGLGNDTALIWTATPNVGSTPVVPLSSVFQVNGPPICCGVQAPTSNPMGSQQLALLPALAFVPGIASNITTPGNDQPLTSVKSNVFATWMTEFPQTGAQAGTVGLVSNISGYSGNITIADVGNCTSDGVATTPSFGGSDTYANILAQGGLPVAVPGPTISDCAVTATDALGNTAELYVFVSSSSVTISNKIKTQNTTRKH